MEQCVLVTRTPASIDDLRKFISDHLENVLPRGNTASSRMMILSGCHGTEDGKDGVNSLECLTGNDQSDKKETRMFYEDMCTFFQLNSS